MFTPPPSPLPHPLILPDDYRPDDMSNEFIPQSAVDAEKKLTRTRRTKWTILLVPAVLILITLSTRHLTHPAAFDILTTPVNAWSGGVVDWSVHSPHKRSPQVTSVPLSAGPTSTVASQLNSTTNVATSTTTTDQTQQTIPPAPTTTPVLPTPFPQPFDTTLSNNFSTQGCDAFFTNMTQTEPFRTCRPFSLLESSSSAFISAQTNLSELNVLLWGTCNTDTTEDQCVANMGWFAQELQTVCSIDLQNGVTLAKTALTGLQAYDVMRKVGCLIDQTTQDYCYELAVHNSNPSDLYFYQLPLGVALPNTTTPSCSPCTKSVMAVFAEEATNLTALKQTYPAASAVASNTCGSGYVEALEGSAGRVHGVNLGMILLSVVVAFVSAWGIL